MTALASHVWGVSHAADRVWAQVVGLAPSKAGDRLLMVWQAYLDESIDSDLFVLAGYIAPAERWASFAKEWERMLRLGCIGEDGRYRFKMSEMAALSERMERVEGFFRIIQNHELIAISATMRPKDFKAARARIDVIDREPLKTTKVRWPQIDNEYQFLFTVAMSIFHQNRDDDINANFIPPHQKIDFIFDERREKREILSAWESFLETSPMNDRYGATPRFENDDDFLPLQAADFFAWWVRRWAKEGKPGEPRFPWDSKPNMDWFKYEKIKDSIPQEWDPKRDFIWHRYELTEDEITEAMLKMLRGMLSERYAIFDQRP